MVLEEAVERGDDPYAHRAPGSVLGALAPRHRARRFPPRRRASRRRRAHKPQSGWQCLAPPRICSSRSTWKASEHSVPCTYRAPLGLSVQTTAGRVRTPKLTAMPARLRDIIRIAPRFEITVETSERGLALERRARNGYRTYPIPAPNGERSRDLGCVRIRGFCRQLWHRLPRAETAPQRWREAQTAFARSTKAQQRPGGPPGRPPRPCRTRGASMPSSHPSRAMPVGASIREHRCNVAPRGPKR